MQGSRHERLQSLIREELANAIARDIKDPRVGRVTVTQVRLSNDRKNATVLITLLGGKASNGGTIKDSDYDQQLKFSLSGLTSARGFLKRQLGRALALKQIPNIQFEEDLGLENTFRVNQLLSGLSPTKPLESK